MPPPLPAAAPRALLLPNNAAHASTYLVQAHPGRCQLCESGIIIHRCHRLDLLLRLVNPIHLQVHLYTQRHPAGRAREARKAGRGGGDGG